LKRHKVLFAVVAAFAAITVLGVQSASADPGGQNHDYVCFSSVAGPMLVSSDDSSVFPTWSTFATGYFAPMAESTVPTTTQIAGGWYLTCNLAPGWTEIGSYILGDGSKIDLSGPTDYLVNSLPIQGVYAVIQPAAPTAGA